MRTPLLWLCLFMFLSLSRSFSGDEFIVEEYRAYSLIGEAKLFGDRDYVSFTGDYGFSSRLPSKEALERYLAYESRLLSKFTVSVINLEFMLTGLSGRERDRQVDNVMIDILKGAGYDVIARANNHAMDYGLEGARYNAGQLKKAGMGMIGTREFPVYEWHTGGKKVAIFALADQTDRENQGGLILTINEADLRLVRDATSKVDVRIAFVHLGSMSFFPSPHEHKQATRLLEAGADLVVATGTHFIKGFVIEKGKPVAYGLGNHLFSYVGGPTEPVGMHLVAGFRLGELVQVFVVPFHNAIFEGKAGPLDEATFASFKRDFSERSTTSIERYFSDARSLEMLKKALSRYSCDKLRDFRVRHVGYAARIMFYHYPAGVTTAVILGLVLCVLWGRGRVRKLRRGYSKKCYRVRS